MRSPVSVWWVLTAIGVPTGDSVRIRKLEFVCERYRDLPMGSDPMVDLSDFPVLVTVWQPLTNTNDPLEDDSMSHSLQCFRKHIPKEK